MMKRPALIVAVVALVVAHVQPSPRADALYFPSESGEWARVQPGAAGWDERALDAALDYAGRTNSTGVVVLLNGRLLAERRWLVEGPERYRRMVVGKTSGGDVVEDVASVQKSVVAFLTGVAEGKRLIDLEAPVSHYLGHGWSKANEEAEFAITVRHLMTMTSGLNDSGEYQAPAGQTWRYNTGMYSKVIGILEKAAGADIETLTTEWLTGPAGMSDSKWVRRAWSAGNNAANSIGFATTPRDLARFGLLVLAKGTWNGRDLLRNPSYFERMLRPSQDLNPSYGLLWWLNGQPRVQSPDEAQAKPGSLTPSAPGDLVAAQGAQDRKCYIVPSLSLVVSRLGAPTGASPTVDLKWDDEFWKLLMKAAPVARTK
jgi:CubicO group peptidase (beta-lactamase class C family)